MRALIPRHEHRFDINVVGYDDQTRSIYLFHRKSWQCLQISSFHITFFLRRLEPPEHLVRSMISLCQTVNLLQNAAGHKKILNLNKLWTHSSHPIWIWLAFKYFLLIFLVMRRHHRLDFAFVTMLTKWQSLILTDLLETRSFQPYAFQLDSPKSEALFQL